MDPDFQQHLMRRVEAFETRVAAQETKIKSLQSDIVLIWFGLFVAISLPIMFRALI